MLVIYTEWPVEVAIKVAMECLKHPAGVETL
jgi:hypothetical protein